MRPSLRFLALAVLGWAGFRAATVGALPGAQLFGIGPSQAKPAAVVPTQFAAIEPVEPASPVAEQPQTTSTASPPTSPPAAQIAAPERTRAAAHYVRGVVGVPVAMHPGTVTVYDLPPSTPEPPVRAAAFTPSLYAYRRADYAVLPSLDGALSSISSLPAPASHPSGTLANESVPALEERRIDRLQLSSWALLRNQQTGIAGSRSLAPGGQLGASQAGARLLYNVKRQIAVSGRLSSPVGTRGGEGAAGLRVRPLVHIPVWLTAERRQAIGRFGGGRSAFALLLEGGVYEQPLPWRFSLDSYFQAGVVSFRQRDLFFDGGLAVTRPLWRNFSAGFGVWGGAQPHLGRLDAGPRLTIRVRKNMKVHVDWRQKLVGNARPGSGPTLTLAGDF